MCIVLLSVYCFCRMCIVLLSVYCICFLCIVFVFCVLYLFSVAYTSLQSPSVLNDERDEVPLSKHYTFECA
jgi:hypothetical protein